MDEAQTLRLLGWTVGGIVGALFVLNAIALSLIEFLQPISLLLRFLRGRWLRLSPWSHHRSLLRPDDVANYGLTV